MATTTIAARGLYAAAALPMALLLLLAAEDELPAPPVAAPRHDIPDQGLTAVSADMPRPDLMAAPAGERQLTATPGELRVALGSTALALGGDELLAPWQRRVPMLRSIVDDRDALELLLLGRIEFAITSAPLTQRERDAGLWDTPLGVELFALVVAESSPLQGLRRDVARRLLNGELLDRADLGLPAGAITLGVPAERGARERAAHALIAGDAFARHATLIDGDRGAFDLLLREPTAIAVVHVAAIAHASGVRMLDLDCARPTAESFALGTYTAGTPLQLVTAGAPRGVAAALAAAVADDAGALAPDRLVAPARR